MGGAISVIMSGIHMNRLEKEPVMPLKPKFYKRYVDDTITKRKKNTNFDELFQNMNSPHPNIKLTVETNPTRFLDTAFSKNLDGSITTNAFCKPGKLPTFWNSQIPKRYKQNNIRGDLHGALKIASDFHAGVQTIAQKYLEVGYSIVFIKSVINDFKNSKDEEQLIIPEWLFDQRKKVLFKLPYCPSNERDVKRFIDKIESFTNGKLKFIVLWSTRNIKSLFPLKDRVKHLSCIICEGKCLCGKSEPAKHLADNKSHMFTWKVLEKHLDLYMFVKEKSLKRFSLQN